MGVTGGRSVRYCVCVTLFTRGNFKVTRLFGLVVFDMDYTVSCNCGKSSGERPALKRGVDRLDSGLCDYEIRCLQVTVEK